MTTIDRGLFLVIAQYGVVCREIGVKRDGKILVRIQYGTGWPGIFGYNNTPLQRIMAIRLRLTTALEEP